MALDFQTASIAFGQGLDTKTDPKEVIQGKLLVLRNGIFTNAKRLSKRNGYDSMTMSKIGGGSITTPYMTQSFVNRLVCADGASLFDYSTSLTAWANGGKYDSIKSTNIPVTGAQSNASNTQMIVVGNYALVSVEYWTAFTGSPTVSTTLYAIDLTTNTLVASSTSLGAFPPYAKLFKFSDDTIFLFGVSSGTLVRYKLTISSSGITVVSGPTNVLTNMQVFGNAPNVFYSYDVCANGSNVNVVGNSTATSGTIYLATINSSGTVTQSTTVTSVGNAFPLTLSVDSSNQSWVYWANNATAGNMPATNSTIKYMVRSSTLTSTLATTNIATGVDRPRQIAVQTISASAQQMFYSSVVFSHTTGGATVDVVTPAITGKNVTVGGAVSTGSPGIAANLDLFGNVFTYNSKQYLPVVFPSTDQFTGFLIDLTDGHAAGKFLYNCAEAAYGVEVNAHPETGGFWWRYPGFLSNTAAYGSTKFFMGSGKVVQTIPNTTATVSSATFSMAGAIVSFEWNSTDSFQALEANGALLLNGSIVSQYDGQRVTELNFNWFPEINVTPATSGGSMADGSYTYYAVYKYIDNLGNIHFSSPSDPLTAVVSGGAGSGKVTVLVKGNYLTQKESYSVQIYRTLDAGTIAYLVTELANTSSVTQSYVDTGASLNQSEPIYTNGGAILANVAPPCSMVMWLNNNRAWLLDSENPDTDVWYTKTFARLTGIATSAELINVTDPRFGNITAGAAMDEKTIILKEQGLQYFIGDGANDAGQGSSFTLSQIIPSDVGCSYSKGVIVYTDGLIFRASSNKGIYRLNRGMQVEYLGASVQEFNSQDIKDAQMIADKSQIRFLTSSGYSLVYDYIFNQWSTFSNHAGYSSTVWNGTYVYARTDGAIYKENATTYLDNATAIALYAKTAWFKGASTQNFQRVKSVEVLGDQQGTTSHGLQISVAYDFASTSTDLEAIYFDDTDGPYQYQGFMPRQKCDAFQLIFNEIASGAAGEFIDLSDLAIEIGIKKGLNKLPAAQSVG